MAITVQKPRTAKLESQQAGRTPGQSGSAYGGPVVNKPAVTGQTAQASTPSRLGMKPARNTITPNRGGVGRAPIHASLRKKLFRSY